MLTSKDGKNNQNLVHEMHALRQELINRLDVAYFETSKGDPFTGLPSLIDDLTGFAAAHFNYLNTLFDHIPDRPALVRDDIDFIHNISLLKKAYRFENGYVKLTVLSSLTNWLSHNTIERTIRTQTRC